MKISVIIPALNEEKRIGQAIQAIKAQNYPNIEIIVVDNGSADRTAEIANAAGALVLREDRKGTMWACEKGRQSATGEIIVRMDADCEPASDWLSKGAAHFPDTRVAGVSGPYDYFDGAPFFRKSSLLFQKYIYKLTNSILQALHLGGVSTGGNTFMRGSALAAAGGFNTSIVFYGDDTDTPKRLSKHGRWVFDPNLIIKTSARRFKAEGTLNLMLKYWYHFFRTVFSGK